MFNRFYLNDHQYILPNSAIIFLQQKPLINQDLFHGFINTPIESISIVDVELTESIVVKEELPAVCEELDDIIEPQEDDSDNGKYFFWKNCIFLYL